MQYYCSAPDTGPRYSNFQVTPSAQKYYSVHRTLGRRAGDTGDRGIKSFAETENIYNHHHQSVSGLMVRGEVQLEVYVMAV